MQFFPEGLGIQNVSLAELIKAKEEKTILEGTVVKATKDNTLIVSVGEFTGTIAIEEFEYTNKETKPLSIIFKVGRKIQFIVKEVNEDGSSLVLSRREAQKIYREYIRANVRKGDIIDAKVTDATEKEVYLDIGVGCKAVLYRENISVTLVSDAREYFKKGQMIKVAVVRNIPEKGIVATHKELLGTFEENIEHYEIHEDDTIVGTINRITEQCIYIEIGQNLLGMVNDYDFDKLSGAKVGDSAVVNIRSIIPERAKIKLQVISKGSDKIEHKFEYFVKDDHIDLWRYSPEKATRIVETDFSVE